MSTRSEKKISPAFIVFLLCIVFFLVNFLSLLGLSPTYDESIQVIYGSRLLHGDSNRMTEPANEEGVTLVGTSMPITALNVLPGRLGEPIPAGWLKTLLGSGIASRLISVIVSMLFAVLVFHWARSLYGYAGAWAAFMLYIFDPNLIAFSHIIGTDMYAWGATLLLFYCGWRFSRERSAKNLVLLGASLGLGLIVKYTTIIYPVLLLLALAIADLPQFMESWKNKRIAAIKKFTGQYAVYAACLSVIAWLIVCAAFLFERTFTPFGEYRFHSHLMQSIQSGVPWLSGFPVPTPYVYLEGFDTIYYYGETGTAYGNIYLLGELRDGTDGFYGYYLIASLFKMPIATQLIVFAALWQYLKDERRRERFLSDEIFLFIPVAYFVFYFNTQFNINIGIRYYLIFFPLLYVFCGSLFADWASFSRPQKAVSVGLVLYLFASMISYFPNFIPYFNELMPDRKMAYKILADSNLNYGQAEYKLTAYLQDHPEAVFNPDRPSAGRVVVDVNELVGVLGDPEKYSWLRENFEPDDTVAYGYLVYDISEEELAALCSKINTCP